MARIRTIKPELPQSESMGRVSRDARLCFILLWTIADDSGRLRGNSRMLASLLFPYDDDAKDLIDGWLSELEGAGCIVRYKIGADTYLEICNWLIHQKIDKPSKSKIPQFDESSRILATPRELSSEDQGSRIKDQGGDQGPGEDQGPLSLRAAKKSAAAPETGELWSAYASAYQLRYGAIPVRNAKVNGQLSQLIRRIGGEEAPAVAAWYVASQNRFYVQKRHSVDCLLADAEGLRTEWATNTRVTETKAREADRLQTSGDMWSRLIDETQAEEANGNR